MRRGGKVGIKGGEGKPWKWGRLRMEGEREMMRGREGFDKQERRN